MNLMSLGILSTDHCQSAYLAGELPQLPPAHVLGCLSWLLSWPGGSGALQRELLGSRSQHGTRLGWGHRLPITTSQQRAVFARQAKPFQTPALAERFSSVFVHAAPQCDPRAILNVRTLCPR